MKLLHCADLHLDSPMRGLSRHEGAPEELLRGATRRAFERAVQLAVDEGVGAVVVAGDLYDGDRDDYNTAIFFQRQLHVLREAGIKVVIAYGNHDAASEITRRLSLPDNTTVLPTDAAGTVVFQDLGVAFHGRSYPTRVVDEDFSATYPQPLAGAFNVGVLHTSLDGRPGHDRYAPCTIDGLVRRGYGYWALGHVHQREEHLRDGVTVVFPGNVCGRDVGELGSKGATLVEYDGDAVVSTTHRELAPVTWHRLEIADASLSSPAGVNEAVLERLAQVRSTSACTLHAVRVDIAVDQGVFGQWERDLEHHLEQLRADAAGGDGRVWLERVEVQPVRGGSAPPPVVTDDAFGAITETLDALRTTEAGRSGVRSLLEPLRSRFGADREAAVRLGALGLDDTSVDALFEEAAALLEAELGTADPGAGDTGARDTGAGGADARATAAGAAEDGA